MAQNTTPRRSMLVGVAALIASAPFAAPALAAAGDARPDAELIPIGDRYTMGPTTAAYACNELLDLKTIVPMHWGTFPALTGTPAAFKALVKRGAVLVATPGQTIEV